MNQECIPVVKPTDVETTIWQKLSPVKTGGLVRNQAFVFRDVLDWPEWYVEPDKLNPEHWESKLLAGCRGEWFANVVEGCEKVLDVGCGFGFPSFYLARYGHQVVGVDPSQSEIATAIELAKRIEVSGNVQFEVVEQSSLPFENNSFDAATLGHSLECMAEPEVLLRELKRVLKPGSPIAIEEENRPFDPATHPVWEKANWAFFDGEIWVWFEVRISDPHLDRRYMLRIDPKSEIATKLGQFEPYIEMKSKGMPVVDFEEVGISWDDALSVVVESTWSEARGFDGPSLQDLLESAGFTSIQFFTQPDGKRFAESLAGQGLLDTMPDDIRSVLRASVKAAPLTDRPVSTMVSCITPGTPSGHFHNKSELALREHKDRGTDE